MALLLELLFCLPPIVFCQFIVRILFGGWSSVLAPTWKLYEDAYTVAPVRPEAAEGIRMGKRGMKYRQGRRAVRHGGDGDGVVYRDVSQRTVGLDRLKAAVLLCVSGVWCEWREKERKRRGARKSSHQRGELGPAVAWTGYASALRRRRSRLCSIRRIRRQNDHYSCIGGRTCLRGDAYTVQEAWPYQRPHALSSGLQHGFDHTIGASLSTCSPVSISQTKRPSARAPAHLLVDCNGEPSKRHSYQRQWRVTGMHGSRGQQEEPRDREMGDGAVLVAMLEVQMHIKVFVAARASTNPRRVRDTVAVDFQGSFLCPSSRPFQSAVVDAIVLIFALSCCGKQVNAAACMLACLTLELSPFSFFHLLSLVHNNNNNIMTPPHKRTDSTTAIIDHKQPSARAKLAAAWNAIKEPFRRKRTHRLLKRFSKAQQSRHFNTATMTLPPSHLPRRGSELQAQRLTDTFLYRRESSSGSRSHHHSSRASPASVSSPFHPSSIQTSITQIMLEPSRGFGTTFEITSQYRGNIATLTNLERLWATNNKLSGPFDASLSALGSLREIDARFNSISNIDVLSQLPMLEALMLGHNSVSQFEGSFHCLTKLTISKNHFVSLSTHFGSLAAERIPFKSSKTRLWVESTYGSGSTFFFTCIVSAFLTSAEAVFQAAPNERRKLTASRTNARIHVIGRPRPPAQPVRQQCHTTPESEPSWHTPEE
ncbi:uncharacterized protein MYCFIDRAFT_175030 [Pseudocercospora fijiensis CIRAD86]|uniref:Uncharacterized protein n=1 Tax=Pseudocercospora fijiensis (strain CIRAD86) TaxID=383855 RepID=M2Z191_PSEFD|nr:uncharacterized protein MYCFIDRAFT_175030 [Pseudocercospora fijiensis CIRAD86]EME83605.1 hypothetical protein MYCFIDRAFT_175030 [Pseudocercospora fijiensis CIRAD86]